MITDAILTLPVNTHPPGVPFGSVRIPGSKSVGNRLLLLAALAEQPCRLEGLSDAEDSQAMVRCLRACGSRIESEGSGLRVHGAWVSPRLPLEVGASGTTLRFLVPVLVQKGMGEVVFSGDPRLFDRPMEPLMQALAPLGGRWEPRHAGACLKTGGPHHALHATVDGSLSSQFLTGLLLAAAGAPGGGCLQISQVPASASYLELTRHWLGRVGCQVIVDGARWRVPGGTLRPQAWEVPADWSGAAAFFAAAAVTGRRAALAHLDPSDPQGDRAILDILARAGCQVHVEASSVVVQGPLQVGLDADLSDCPDLGPVLAATAALAPGPSVLRGLETLPHKECDRLDASRELVHWLGGQAEIMEQRMLRITPGIGSCTHSPFDPRNDHRMAFAAAVGALRHGGQVLNPGCVAKTYPAFWADWARFLEG